jgi:dTDP-glucose 4,6-dehydratase
MILVTGGAGFIGGNFVLDWLADPHAEAIVNLDKLTYAGNLATLQSLEEDPRYVFVHGDIGNYDLVLSLFRKYQIRAVINFAAQSHVQNSFSDSLQYSHDNVLGTHTLLEACRLYGGVQKFIHISTDEVYGESMLEEDENKKNEESVLCPTNPYAATKAAAELIAKSYYYSFKMPIIITRGNNVYGPNQYPEKLIPRFITQLLDDKQVTIQGDGKNVRAFLHVNDVCSGLKLILEKGIIGEIYNIGSDDDSEYTVMEIANKLIYLIKEENCVEKWITYIEDRPFNDKRYYISNQKLKDLGWKIKINFDEGIRELIIHYKNKINTIL